MNKNNILKILVPVVAIVVLLESVLLIMNLKNRQVVKEVVEETKSKTAFNLTVESESPNIKLGVASPIEVKAVASSDKALDSINVYLAYNPTAFEVTEMVFDSRLPKPTFSKASTTKGLIVVNFLISEPEGLKVKAGEALSLVRFMVKPKMTGKFDFEISSGNEAKESATMFVENTTSEILSYTSSKLTVNVGR